MPAIPLGPFGLHGPEDVACVAVRYQIAQKLHACTEVFARGRTNNRFRDLIDVLMLRASSTTWRASERPASRSSGCAPSTRGRRR